MRRIRRWTRVTSGLLVATLVLYAFSLWGCGLGGDGWFLASRDGAVGFIWSEFGGRFGPTPTPRIEFDLGHNLTLWCGDWCAPGDLCLLPEYVTSRGMFTGQIRGIGVPFWPLPILAIAAWLLARRARRRLKREFGDDACTRCGYNLRGNVSGRCPECGAAVVREKADSGAATR